MTVGSTVMTSFARTRRPLWVTSSAQHAMLQRNRSAARCLWTVNSETGIVSREKEPVFQTIIGLEIHAQLDIPTKLFSAAKTTSSFSQAPNTSVHPFDLAVPGTLPLCSQSAVQAAVLTAAALHCEISPVSRFERKHYHYADLPFGYQITQQRWPIARNGTLRWKSRSVGIDRIQLEQDTGKTTTTTKMEYLLDAKDNESSPSVATTTLSLVDFNRAGSALVEIVMNPDLRSSQEAAEAVDTLRKLLKHIGTCNGKMEEGSLRVDLNVSIQPLAEEEQTAISLIGGNRVEVKNLNSLKQVQQAAEFEAIRQAELFADGKSFRETRTFNPRSGQTLLLRKKEGEEDYRFMPEPDLPPVVLSEKVFGGRTIQQFLDDELLELPEEARKRLVKDYGLNDYAASVLSGDPPSIKLYDEAVKVACRGVSAEQQTVVPEAVAKLLCNELFSLIREQSEKDLKEFGDDEPTSYSNVNGQQLGELVRLLLDGTVSNTMATKILSVLFKEEFGRSPVQVADERGYKLVSDPEALRILCRDVISKFPKQLDDYRTGGKFVHKMKKFFVGKAMASSKGNAHPERLHEALEDVLGEVAPGVE